MAYGPRASLVLKADIRPDHENEIEGKLTRLDAELKDGTGQPR